MSGIDTSIFMAHSTKEASSLAAENSGITINDILKAADWSTELVFRKFYYWPTHDPLYGRAGCTVIIEEWHLTVYFITAHTA